MAARKKSAPKAKAPEPVVVSTICSLCGENWHAHRADASGEVTTLECIRLLRARPVPTHYVGQWYQPYQYPYQWTWTSSAGLSAGNVTSGLAINASSSPKVLTASSA